ncbi:MAG: FAD-dependent oxidoreductase [Burkholderiaceae bacterium]|nr:FAD-dependent oxidoreductase [Burkholderiaceae bacterium]
MNTSDTRDLRHGVPLRDLRPGVMVPGQVDGVPAMLVRSDEGVFALGARCTHYQANLCDGLLADHVLRCPLHHSRFDISTGEAVGAPALDALPCWHVEVVDGKALVRKRIEAPIGGPVCGSPNSIVIVGGGAAGLAAAEMLRRKGYNGALTMVSADADPPIDRPNLSKDYLAGGVPDEWMPLRSPAWYKEQQVELLLNTSALAVDTAAKRLRVSRGTDLPFDRLLLATGAKPVELVIPGATLDQVFTLRSFADCRRIIAQAARSHSAVVIGSSFVGLEVAASLVGRGLKVHVVSTDTVPMLRTFGSEIGQFLQRFHESQGVTFHLGTMVREVNGTLVTLADGTRLRADLIIAGVGVRPRLGLAEKAGLAIDRGVVVDEYLQTSAPGIYAAGDIARYPDPYTGQRIRVEHWALAQRQGQVAALNMLGMRQRFDAVPFFWSQHYDVAIQYIGHAERWDAMVIEGSVAARDCGVTYLLAGQRLALATIGRDASSLAAERAIKSGNAQTSTQRDTELDEALAMTFPASDPVAIDRSIA